MRGLVPAAVVTGVLLAGGLPAVALTSSADDSRDSSDAPSVPSAAAGTEPGPPPWAHARRHHSAGEDDDRAEDDDRPGHGRKGEHGPPAGRGNGHGRQMRAWAHCVGDAARALPSGARLDPEKACGDRPEPPGRSKD